MSDDAVNLEVNGVPVEARKGQMLIEVTDAAGMYVPRFCYHEKLSIAANCRMCLVQVEKAPKPLPACATPVAEGMKVFTKSPYAIAAQRATMEFLLINHPLDCPICDQGGECELQDLAMGFGRDISRYTEKKRSVRDKNIGPLVSTDMTRCIHCTRCVRFGEEVAGLQELGTIGRGENMEIGTYVERSVDHELSGNIIDLCPVGALNNKPFRFRARSWEMLQKATVAPHDAVGSNIYAHVLGGKVMRVVPRPNEAINETWISDRDRFSCHGLYADDRLERPMIKDDGEWVEASWADALELAASRLAKVVERGSALDIGCLVSPSATLEEQYLAARLTRGLGSPNIDHRVRATDFSAQEDDPACPGLGVSIEAFEAADALFVVASDLRHEAPILGHRARKAALRGADVCFLNPAGFEYLFPVSAYIEATASSFVAELAAVVSAAAEHTGKPVPDNVAAAVADVTVSDAHRTVAARLAEADNAVVTLGLLAARHPAAGDLRALAGALASLTGASVGTLTEGANSAGAYLAGAVPHRGPGGRPAAESGLDAGAMRAGGCQAYLLVGLEPEDDCHDGEATADALAAAGFVVAVGPYVSETARRYADVLLPSGTFAETSRTYVNLEGRWQSFSGVASPYGEARPAWKILRVLANHLGLDGFDYQSSEDVRDELRGQVDNAVDQSPGNTRRVGKPNGVGSMTEVPAYSIDPLVRRSRPLQETRLARADARRF